MISITKEQKALLADFKNYVPETYYHCLRVKKMVCMMVKKIEENKLLDYTADQMDLICKGAMLHDIGKINIDNKILTWRGNLTEEEKECIKKHTSVGADLIDEYLDDNEKEIIKEICLYHHERTDGSGYFGLKEIPDYVQIISICDVYDALASDRVYREGFDRETALKMIENGECGNFPRWLINSLKEAVLGD